MSLRLALSGAMREWARHPRSGRSHRLGARRTLFALVLALTVILLWQLRAIWRRRDSWALYLGAALLLVLVYKTGKYVPQPPSILWASLLVSRAVGLGIFQRRYE